MHIILKLSFKTSIKYDNDADSTFIKIIDDDNSDICKNLNLVIINTIF